jgi:hypothetical protein
MSSIFSGVAAVECDQKGQRPAGKLFRKEENMNYNPVRRQKEIGRLLGTAAAALLLALPAATLAGEAKPGGAVPEKITINIQASCPQIADLDEDKKEVKDFSHRLHAEKYLSGRGSFAASPFSDEFTCVACHAGAKSKQDLMAADRCERLSAAVAAGGGPKNYKQTMHGICQECHKRMQKAGEKAAGPTKCADCHK